VQMCIWHVEDVEHSTLPIVAKARRAMVLDYSVELVLSNSTRSYQLIGYRLGDIFHKRVVIDAQLGDRNGWGSTSSEWL
jgi:hypothetical protein